jgi:hypothetical protein
MKTLKTCKTGCGKMKSGGAVKKVKKMAQGGQMYGIPQTGPTGPNIQGVDTMKRGGSVKKMSKGGSLKPVSSDQKGLAKLPTAVRNKMGYQKRGGMVKKK